MPRDPLSGGLFLEEDVGEFGIRCTFAGGFDEGLADDLFEKAERELRVAGEWGFNRAADVGIEFKVLRTGRKVAKAGLMELVFAGFGSGFGFLRFEPNFGAAPFGSEAEQVVQALVKRTLMGGLIAKIKCEALVVGNAFGVEAGSLKPEGTIGEPGMLGQMLDEEKFGCGGRLMLGGERVLEFGKVGGGLGFEKNECTGEAGTQVLRDEANLPSSVLGPVEDWAFS